MQLEAFKEQVVTGNFFPEHIRSYSLSPIKSVADHNISKFGIHDHYSTVLNPSEFDQLVAEIGMHLSTQKQGTVHSFFHKTEEKGWVLTCARLNRNGNDLPSEIILFDYHISELSLEKNKLEYFLQNLSSFKKHYQNVALLTRKEKQVISMVAEGMDSNEIATTTYTSIHTINTHRKNIKRKLNTDTLSELIHLAVVFDLINPGYAEKV